MARYTVLRLMIFFGFLCAFYLAGLRDVSQQWWLLGLSAVASTVVSYFVLRGPREEFSAKIARRIDERAHGSERDDSGEHARRGEHARTSAKDETAEDVEADGGTATAD
jgi:hypothetical protein